MYCPKCGAYNIAESRFCHECGVSLSGQPTYVPEVRVAQRSKVAKTRKGWLTLVASFLFMLSIIVWQVLGMFVGYASGLDSDLCMTCASAVGAVVGVVALGGANMLKLDAKKLAEAWKRGWWVIAVSLALALIEMFSLIGEGSMGVADGWALRLLSTVILLACVGIHEEAAFRGLLLCGLLDAFGKRKPGVVVSVVLSSLMFGAMHVIGGAFDPTRPVDWMQVMLKTLQTGMFGFFLAALVLETDNLWGPITLHSVSNFTLVVISTVFQGQELNTEYVSSDSDGIYMVILYSVVILAYLPLVWKGIRMLGNAQAPHYGAFHKERFEQRQLS